VNPKFQNQSVSSMHAVHRGPVDNSANRQAWAAPCRSFLLHSCS
jgi:hypothetical protein